MPYTDEALERLYVYGRPSLPACQVWPPECWTLQGRRADPLRIESMGEAEIGLEPGLVEPKKVFQGVGRDALEDEKETLAAIIEPSTSRFVWTLMTETGWKGEN